MTMLERVGSYSNEYFNSLIREYTDKARTGKPRYEPRHPAPTSIQTT